jgi:hypothetical protein
MKNWFDSLSIVLLTLAAFCPQFAFADSPTIVIDEAVYRCLSEKTPTPEPAPVLDKIKTLCEGKSDCRVNVDPTIAPPGWIDQYCKSEVRMLFIQYHCSNVASGAPPRVSAGADGLFLSPTCSHD